LTYDWASQQTFPQFMPAKLLTFSHEEIAWAVLGHIHHSPSCAGFKSN